MLAFKAGLIHRDLSDGNVMIMDDGPFNGFLLDLDYAFNWMEALELAGEVIDEETWMAYTKKYNEKVAGLNRPNSEEDTSIPPIVAGRETQASHVVDPQASWAQRMKMKERTVCFIAFRS